MPFTPAALLCVEQVLPLERKPCIQDIDFFTQFLSLRRVDFLVELLEQKIAAVKQRMSLFLDVDHFTADGTGSNG